MGGQPPYSGSASRGPPATLGELGGRCIEGRLYDGERTAQHEWHFLGHRGRGREHHLTHQERQFDGHASRVTRRLLLRPHRVELDAQMAAHRLGIGGAAFTGKG